MHRFLKLFFKESVRAAAVPLFLLGAIAVALAFTEPSVGPAGGTVYAPVNTGGTAQTKSGNFTSSGTLTGNTVNATGSLCLAADGCRSTWPAGGGSGTVTSVSAGTGMSFSTITTSGSVSLNTSGISSCTDSINSKIYWNGSQLVCGADQNSGGAGGYWSVSGSNIYNTNSGNVGIGTASPSEKLHVNGSLYVGSNFYKAGNITSVNNAISLWSAEGGVISGFNNGRAVAMGQTTSGYPGFGVSSGATSLSAFYHDPFSNETVVEAFGARNIRFATNGAGRMTVNSSGNVGIGRTPAWAKLEVGGQLQVYPAGTGRFFVEDAGSGGIANGAYQDGVGFRLLQLDGNVVALQTRSGGSVGIGTTGPSQKLEVNGNIKAGRIYVGDLQYGSLSNRIGIGTDGSAIGVQGAYLNVGTQSGTAYAPVYASDYWISNAGRWASSPSDLRLKENIMPLADVLGKLQNIQGVSFNWNDAYAALGHPNDKRQIGVIAQELEKQFPELVTVSSTNGYKTVNYEGLTAVLLEAAKEQQKEIDSLRARIDALEKK